MPKATVAVLTCVLCWPVIAGAQTDTVETKTEFTHQNMQASDYGLSEAEMMRYHEIMKGPRGRWYTDLDPSHVLGIVATTDEDRRYFAQIAAEIEVARVEAELAFNRAYSEAVSAISPVMIDDGRWAKQRTRRALKPEPLTQETPQNRKALYVDGACEACDDRVKQVLVAYRHQPVDIYVDNMVDDDAIRRWAARHRISPSAVEKRQLTLNHYQEGVFKESPVGETVVLFTDGPFGLIRVSQEQGK